MNIDFELNILLIKNIKIYVKVLNIKNKETLMISIKVALFIKFILIYAPSIKLSS